jgi:hypothetical protein
LVAATITAHFVAWLIVTGSSEPFEMRATLPFGERPSRGVVRFVLDENRYDEATIDENYIRNTYKHFVLAYTGPTTNGV